MLRALYYCKRFTSSLSKSRIKNLCEVESNENVTVEGWIRNVRKHKSVAFLNVNDGSCLQSLQVVLEPSMLLKRSLNYGTPVRVVGNVTQRPGKNPNIELHCKSIEVVSQCNSEDYPFVNERAHPLEYYRQFIHLRNRTDATGAVLRVRDRFERSFHEYFHSLGFIHIHTPMISSNDCEGAGELFTLSTQSEAGEVDNDKTTAAKEFFSKPVFLTVSSQLHLEACALGVGDVYTLSPAFRAEKSNTSSHLSEFRMLEVEVAFIKSLDDLMQLLEDSIKEVVGDVMSCMKNEIEFFHEQSSLADYGKIVAKSCWEKFVRMDYSEAVEILSSANKNLQSKAIKWGDDLNSEQETYITNHTGNVPVFICNFPASLKPFYCLMNEDNRTVASFDLLFPHCGELAGGALRENSAQTLSSRLRKLDMLEPYEWYVDLRRFGGIPHGGYGLGFDRLIKFVLGVKNIRDVVPFPRAHRQCHL